MHSSAGTNHFYGQCQRAGFEARYERSSDNNTRSAHNEIVASFVAGNVPTGQFNRNFQEFYSCFHTAFHRPCKRILVQATFGEMGRL
jgi:hypothetical protein